MQKSTFVGLSFVYGTFGIRLEGIHRLDRQPSFPFPGFALGVKLPIPDPLEARPDGIGHRQTRCAPTSP